ncbi:MAG: hypothetical protein HQ522_05945 [Bacteroidetes bacterium]|nr:hypothetical protein [Bacteroidota bacterium]
MSVARISTAKNFVKNNKLLILKNLLKVIPNLGGVADGIDSFQELYKKYNEGLEKGQALQEDSVKIFISDLERNFLLEYDNVAKFIQEKLNKIDKKKVLIIDDLDRLDPEHIFRLFNVFSAHFDLVDDNSNKFGFDKIIFVCDIENIRKIFAHKYGSKVDFSGYIDKFYSTEIFYLFHKNVFNKNISPYLEKKIRIRSHDGSPLSIFPLLVLVLKLLFDGHELNIRMLKRIESYKPSFVSENEVIDYQPILFSRFGSKENSVLKSYRFLIVIKILLELFSSKEELVRKFKNALLNYSEKDDVLQSHYYKQFLTEAILFADMDNHKFRVSTKEEEYEFEYSKMNNKYTVTGRYYDYNSNEGEMWYGINIPVSDQQVSNGEFYPILVEAIITILQNGII